MTGSPSSDEDGEAAPCAGCEAVLPGGSTGCHRLFEKLLLAKEYSNTAYGAVHLLCVDAYFLQHPAGQGPRSCAFHLLSLQMALRHDADPAIGRTRPWLQRWMQMVDAVPRLEPPASLGEVTIADVRKVSSPAEYAESVRQWAESVRRAWDIHHDWARGWLERL